MRWFGRTRDRARDLWVRAKNERASPREIGIAVAIGTAACFAPIVWLHLATALLVASVLRVNRLWAAAASQLPSLFGLLRPIILFVEIEVGHLVLTGAWVDLDPRRAVREAPHLLASWATGAAVVAVTLATAFGVTASAWARRRDRRATRTPGEPPRPSSESPT